MRSPRVGIVGAGAIAGHHLRAMRATGLVEPAGLTSRTRERAEGLAREFEVPLVTDSLDELVETARPDALMLFVSAENMAAVASDVMRFGLPLFIEKPAGLSPEENAALAERAERMGVRAMVGFNRRFYSVFHKGLAVIRDAGPLLGVFVEGHERFWRVRDAGAYPESVMDAWMFANGVHTVDLLRFFGGEALVVRSVVHSHRERHGDQFAAVMELESGAIGEYVAHWYSPGGWRVVLYGDGVTVEFRPLEEARWTGTDFQTHAIEPDQSDADCKPGFAGQLEAFATLVREGRLEWPAQDLEGSLRTMQLARAIAAGATRSEPDDTDG